MDARGAADGERDAFLNGFAFGVAAIRGRLNRMQNPSRADLLAVLDEYRELAQRVHASDEPDGTRDTSPALARYTRR